MTIFSRLDRAPRLLTDSDEELPEIQRRILFLLRKQARPMRLKEIANALQESDSWVHPALALLMRRELVSKPARGRYEVLPGANCHRGLAANQVGLRSRPQEHVERLCSG